MRLKNIIFILASILICETRLFSALLINEIAFNTAGDDWVELFFTGPDESIDISGLHVTMYYGGSEALSSEAITLYSFDRPDTSWDDRFAVIHMTAPAQADESDSTGDTNANGCLDVYCDNYSGSLWATDCIVAIDDDNSSSNDGIIDFAAYSNMDGTPNSSISSHVTYAQDFGEWAQYSGENIQECMIDIGTEELPSYVTLARKDADTNSLKDFSLTKYMTPGKENILTENVHTKGKLFKPKNKKISITSGNTAGKYALIPLFIYENCNIRFRIFSSIGAMIHESRLYQDISPGNFVLRWDISGKKPMPGLYLSRIEAVRKELKKSQQERIYIIIGKHR